MAARTKHCVRVIAVRAIVCRVFSCPYGSPDLQVRGAKILRDAMPSGARHAGAGGRMVRRPHFNSERRVSTSFPVVIGAGSHPFPFRTRKLSLLPPMVLHG